MPHDHRAETARKSGYILVHKLGPIVGLLLTGTVMTAAASPTHIALSGDRVFPESVTATSDGTLYVGSIATGGVVKIAPGSEKAVPFFAPAASGTRSIFGVLADETSGTLWVCSNDVSALGVSGPGNVEGNYLKGFDLKTAKLKSSARLPGAKTFCNDIAIGPDGAAYVTNSAAPEILRTTGAGNELEVFKTDPLFAPPADGKGAGLDGIAFGADGNLYVDKFTEAALLQVTIESGKVGAVTALATSRPLVLADALRPTGAGAAFLMIEGAGRLDRVTIAGGQARIDPLREGLDGPTGVAQIGTTAWVSEGQLPALFGQKPPTLPFELQAVDIAR